MSGARGAYSLAARFGASHAFKRAFGHTELEAKLLVALATCELTENGAASRKAIADVTKTGSVNLVTELQAFGLVHQVDRDRHGAYYRLTEAGWAVLRSWGVAPSAGPGAMVDGAGCVETEERCEACL
jgi:hypothetical protein